MHSVIETKPPYIPFFHFPGVLRFGGGWRGVWALDYMFFKFSGESNKQMLFNSLSVDSLGFRR